MKRIAQYFLRGLVVTTPVFLTLYVCWWIVSRVDRMIDVGIPGAGIVVTLTGITLVGFLRSSGANVYSRADRVSAPPPLVAAAR